MFENSILKKMFKNGNAIVLLFVTLFSFSCLFAQENEFFSDAVFSENIKSVQLYVEPLYLTDPVISINSFSQLHLKFDDLDGDSKSYFYTLIQCNYDWTKSELQPYDYLIGFEEQDIRDSKFSFNTDKLYTHYDVLFPNENIKITKTGNYVVKVFLESDQNRAVLTKRFMVVESKTKIISEIKMSGDPRNSNNSQQVNFTVNHHDIEISNPVSELKVLLLQNFRWDNCLTNVQPQFIKPEQLEYYSDLNTSFPAGKEFRNFDTRTLKYRTERVASIVEGNNSTIVYLLPDEVRTNLQYFYMHDNNGKYFPGILDYFDQDAQPDYVFVHFSLPVDYPIKRGKIFVTGAFSGWQLLKNNELQFNSKTSAYETTLFLKQGYYEYLYYFDSDTKEDDPFDPLLLEGNNFEAENAYQIFVYYRPFGSRYDQIIGYKSTDTYNK